MRNYGRYAIGVILLILAILLIVAGFNLVRSLFTPDKPPEKQAQTNKKVDLLAVPRNNETVQYTIIGPVVGGEEHRSIRITVNRDTRTIEVLQGYGNQVIKSQEVPNTLEAYEAFIAALNGAGFTSNVPPEGRGDETQSCPLGRKFIYEVDPRGTDAFRSWSNTCSRTKQGTFTGNGSLVQTLFQRQIPNYNQYTSDVRLG